MDLYQNTSKLIDNWEPSRKYQSEPKYSDDCYQFLKEKMKSVHVTRDDKNSKKGLDIGLRYETMYGAESVGIEFKFNLTKTSEFNRLIGQIETKGRQYQSIIIVLVGVSNNNMVVELKKWISSKDNIMGFSNKIIRLKIKGPID